MINIKKKETSKDLEDLVRETKNYRHPKVVEKIKENFNNKCYLCELKESTFLILKYPKKSL